MTPLRIQRKRSKGWRMPPNTVSVTRPGKYGNLWKVGLADCGCRSVGECIHNSFRVETAVEAVAAFRAWREDCDRLHPARAEEYYAAIRGKNLACFCALCERHKDGKPFDVRCDDCAPCHADPLGALANGFACEAA